MNGKISWPAHAYYLDLTIREFSILLVLASFTLFLGVNAELVLGVIDKPTMYIVNKIAEN